MGTLGTQRGIGWRDIFVVTGTQRQFDMLVKMASEWWDFEIKHKMVHRIVDAEQLRAIPPSRVFVFGSYAKRPDWQKIYEAILIGKHKMLKIR